MHISKEPDAKWSMGQLCDIVGSIQIPADVPKKSVEDGPKFWTLALTWDNEQSSWLLTSAWPNRRACSHLGGEAMKDLFLCLF